MPACLQILDKRMGKLVLQKSLGLSIIFMPKTTALLKACLNSKEEGQLFTNLCTEQNEESVRFMGINFISRDKSKKLNLRN